MTISTLFQIPILLGQFLESALDQKLLSYRDLTAFSQVSKSVYTYFDQQQLNWVDVYNSLERGEIKRGLYKYKTIVGNTTTNIYEIDAMIKNPLIIAPEYFSCSEKKFWENAKKCLDGAMLYKVILQNFDFTETKDFKPDLSVFSNVYDLTLRNCSGLTEKQIQKLVTDTPVTNICIDEKYLDHSELNDLRCLTHCRKVRLKSMFQPVIYLWFESIPDFTIENSIVELGENYDHMKDELLHGGNSISEKIEPYRHDIDLSRFLANF